MDADFELDRESEGLAEPQAMSTGPISTLAGTDCRVVDEFLRKHTGTRSMSPGCDPNREIVEGLGDDDFRTGLRDALGEAAIERIRGQLESPELGGAPLRDRPPEG